MFAGHQVLVSAAFSAAVARLANLVHCGLLASASQDAYGEGFTVLAQASPLGSVPGLSKLVEVQVRDLVVGEESAVLALRWQAPGPGDAPFPVLDADITLAFAGEQATVLKLDGAYRPPPGTVGTGLDRAVLHQAATATVQAFLGRVGEAVAKPVTAARGENAAHSEPGESWPTHTDMP